MALTRSILAASTWASLLAYAAAQGYELPPSYSAPVGGITPTTLPGGVLTSSAPASCLSTKTLVSIATSLAIKTVTYEKSQVVTSLVSYLTTYTTTFAATSVSSIPVYESITSLSCVPLPIPTTKPGGVLTTASCVTGTPIVTGGYTIAYTPVLPTSSTDEFVVSPGYVSQQIAYQDYAIGPDFEADVKYKCQSSCGDRCDSWYIGYNPVACKWRCIQYSALLNPSLLVSSPPGSPTSYIDASAYNAICGPKPYLPPPGPLPTTTPGGVINTPPVSLHTISSLPSGPTTLVTKPTSPISLPIVPTVPSVPNPVYAPAPTSTPAYSVPTSTPCYGLFCGWPFN